METEEGLFSRIHRLYPRMSKGQKRLSDFVTGHYERAVFLTAAELGAMASVSESTAVRFATFLGYDGFPKFHEELEELVRTRLNSMQRMEVRYGNLPQDQILKNVLQNDVEKIRETMEVTDTRAFEMAVQSLLDARSIYVVGIRSCAPLAEFLSFYLRQIFPDVRLIQTSSASEIFEQMIRIQEEDVIIGISFPRYSMRTLKALEFANKRNARVITLTDSIHSPVSMYSSCNLIAKSDMASIVDSLVAPLSLINALIVALSMRRKKEVMHTLHNLEEIWKDYQVYSQDELEYPSGQVIMGREDQTGQKNPSAHHKGDRNE